MSGAESGVLRAATSWLVSAALSIGLVIALGWLPWRRLGGESGSSALLTGAAIAFLGSIGGAVPVLIWTTAALTVASLVAYLRVWLRHMTLYESTGSKL